MKSAKNLTLLVFILALTSWAQTATQTPANPADTQKASAAPSETKTGCPCCQKMAEGKDAMSCCHHGKDGKGEKAATSCCNGKDGQMCMKGDKSAKASCANCECCNGKGEKDCCAHCAKETKMAMSCCGHGHCGMGHDQANMDK